MPPIVADVRPLFCLALAACALAMVMPRLVSEGRGQTFPDFDALPEVDALPDPLVMRDGTPVTTPQDWTSRRKPELRALFEHYMYGKLPPKTPWSATLEGSKQVLGGRATQEQIALTIGSGDCPALHLLLYVPTKRPQGKVPVVVGLNFFGNHTVFADPDIALPKIWLRESPGVVEHRATDAGRGTAALEWPVEAIIDRGYALATLCYGDAMPDKPDFSDGIYPSLHNGQSTRTPDDWGSVAAWAWSIQRAVDFLVTRTDLDPQRIVAFGHSRNGKAALLATAFDERIAAVIPHQAGCGGSAPSRSHNPQAESVARINEKFPHWFSERFHQFGGHENKLPFDQHLLVALCAARPVLLTNGDQDQWANPPGQFEMLRAATPVYRLLGRTGLDDNAREPVDDQLLGTELCFYTRDDKHVVDPAYWEVFLNFADRVLARGK